MAFGAMRICFSKGSTLILRGPTAFAVRLIVLLNVGMATFPVTASVGADVVTYHNDNARTGQQLNETVLTHSSVSAWRRSARWILSRRREGRCAAALRLGRADTVRGTHNGLFVVTGHEIVYAVDAGTGDVYWHVSLLGPGETMGDGREAIQQQTERLVRVGTSSTG
jgi:hypothetical protein